jgi:hypothetical protein
MAGKRSIFEEVGAGATAPLPQGGVINRRGGGGARGAIRVWLMVLLMSKHLQNGFKRMQEPLVKNQGYNIMDEKFTPKPNLSN